MEVWISLVKNDDGEWQIATLRDGGSIGARVATQDEAEVAERLWIDLVGNI